MLFVKHRNWKKITIDRYLSKASIAEKTDVFEIFIKRTTHRIATISVILFKNFNSFKKLFIPPSTSSRYFHISKDLFLGSIFKHN